LRIVDKLLTEGHNPAHLAKQLVRLLRNVLVAKVSGEASSLLQISAEEQARAARVAAQFSEEDLARFLQIMLRTYDDIGYRQEQRFHLELGVMKLVHAQRLLPLEQVLSQAGAEVPKPAARPAGQPSAGTPAPASRKGEGQVSPFEADRSRKSGSPGPESMDMDASRVQPQTRTTATATALTMENPGLADDPARILGLVLTELESAGHKMLASTLESGGVVFADDELRVTVAQPAAVIELMMGQEPKRIAGSAASKAAGRPVKVTVVSGAAPTNGEAAPRAVRNGVSARSRASDDPVVQRMQEKFGAEIRTVIDHRDKS
jgi:DNA polymerase-3 subunit gamma/tau